LEYLGSHPAYYASNFILTADINLTGRSYTTALIAPDTNDDADYQGTGFTGLFDGNYHVISNLTINTLGQHKDYLGLFGRIQQGYDQQGRVKRLGLRNVSITCGNNSEYVGTLAGINEYQIVQCYAAGAVHGGTSSMNLGGLVGASGGNITDSYADVDVFAGASAQILGGFAGTAYGIFSHCYASGFVDNRTSAGGFGGVQNIWFTIIDNCYFLQPGDGGGPNNGIAAPLSDAAMRQQASFVNWDFLGNGSDGQKEIWLMNGAYPILTWQVPVGMRHFAVLGQYWRMTGCTSGQPCDSADWYDDDTIDMKDMAQLAQSWLGPVVKTDYPKVEDYFETGDFTKLPWVQGGNANWVIQSSTVWEGTYSAKSGTISDSQSSSIEFTIDTAGCEIISFYCKVSSESGFDGLTFYIDGEPRLLGLSGEYGWSEISFNFAEGVHTFKWTYSKDSSGSAGSDCAWLDNVRILRLPEE
jgi:hypothetical protein